MKLLSTSIAVFKLLLVSLLMHSCVKNHSCTQSYTLYTPVYKTLSEVRLNIKSNAASAIKNTGKLFVLGNHIFLNELNKGIHIIDNTDPASPVNKYFIDIPGNIDLAVKGNLLYADMYSDLVTLDISDPANIQVRKIKENVFPFRGYTNGFIPDNSKLIVDWIKKDTTVMYDCSNRSSRNASDMLSVPAASASSLAAAATGISGSMARFTLLNNYLYTVTDNALNVFNISQPEQPVFSGKVNMSWGIETLYKFKDNLFIGSNTGMFIFGTSNPVKPDLLGSFTHVRTCDPVIADDNYAYVTLRSGTSCGGFTNQLDVLDIKNLNSPTVVKSYLLTNPHGLSKDGNTLFICDGKAGLKIFDASNINEIRLLQTVMGPETYDVITENETAIVVAKDGLYQYSYSNRSNLRLLSKVSY